MKLSYLLMPLMTVFGLGMSGCASLTSPARSHALDLNASKSYWFDYDASRRGALLLPRNVNNKTDFKVCSEPAPDIAFKTIAGFENKLDYKELGNETKAELTSDVIKLAERGQMVQFLRESLFRLCEISINSDIDAETLQKIYLTILDTALRLESDKPFEIDRAKLDVEIAKLKIQEEEKRTQYAALEQQVAELSAAKRALEQEKAAAEEQENEEEIARLKAALEQKSAELAKQISQAEIAKVELQQASVARVAAESSNVGLASSTPSIDQPR